MSKTGTLYFTRALGEGIIADTGEHIIRFEIVKIAGNHVKVRVAAPPSVRIDRDEIYHLKEGKNLGG